MEKEPATLVALDFDLAADDRFITARADPPVVERSPFSLAIGRSQNFQAILKGEWFLHCLSSDKSAANRAIGAGMNTASTKSRQSQMSEIREQNL
jgi:hypothetical protein